MYSKRDKYTFDKRVFSKYKSLEDLRRVNEIAVLFSESLALESARAIRDELIKNNILTYILDEKCTIKNKIQLLDAIEQVANFPEWGRNWDALIDWISSFHWQEASGYVLIYLNPQKLIERHKADYDMFLDIAFIASARWRVDGVPFKLLTAVPPSGEQCSWIQV